jgi:hypothetical protein
MRKNRAMTKYEVKITSEYAKSVNIPFEQAAQRMIDAATGLKIDTKTLCVRLERLLEGKKLTGL